MSRRLSYCLFLFLLAHAPLFVQAQSDVHFSQFYETSIVRNPALVGIFTDNFKITGYMRSQWSSVTAPYQTGLANAEYRIALGRNSNDFLSLGLLGFMDKAGEIDEKISGFYPAINYNKCLNSNDRAYLSLGFTGGYVQYGFDPTKATFNNQFVGGFFSPANPSNDNLIFLLPRAAASPTSLAHLHIISTSHFFHITTLPAVI
jgi:type IX secretion system PorP/SprF family membrane protein